MPSQVSFSKGTYEVRLSNEPVVSLGSWGDPEGGSLLSAERISYTSLGDRQPVSITGVEFLLRQHEMY